MDLQQDPMYKKNIAEQHPEKVKQMHALLLKDAGWDMPHYNVPWRFSG